MRLRRITKNKIVRKYCNCPCSCIQYTNLIRHTAPTSIQQSLTIGQPLAPACSEFGPFCEIARLPTCQVKHKYVTTNQPPVAPFTGDVSQALPIRRPCENACLPRQLRHL